jgi:hypothetical protein
MAKQSRMVACGSATSSNIMQWKGIVIMHELDSLSLAQAVPARRCRISVDTPRAKLTRGTDVTIIPLGSRVLSGPSHRLGSRKGHCGCLATNRAGSVNFVAIGRSFGNEASKDALKVFLMVGRKHLCPSVHFSSDSAHAASAVFR